MKISSAMLDFIVATLEEVDSYERPVFYDALLDTLYAERIEKIATAEMIKQYYAQAETARKAIKRTKSRDEFIALYYDCHANAVTGNHPCDYGYACDKCMAEDFDKEYQAYIK
jgi:hypothetical protein